MHYPVSQKHDLTQCAKPRGFFARFQGTLKRLRPLSDPKILSPQDEASLERKLRFVNGRDFFVLLFLGVLGPQLAHAADLEQTLRNLVSAFTGRILPILALGYLGKNIFSHVSGDPNAKHETVRVVLGIACLMGLAGVWNFIAGQAR